ncbi:hypothetical protein NMYAN_310013 [Nitrosomonas nitrosa]|uniref:Uncharacterized protein n=1 Tax=Nitrosomonas nitrosa TaxID=52442 RepID=A0A8H8Z2K0_9PROT|nr:hypothetical protein NMYAN_310013 [Nitrosomonas nitrosa]
MIKQVILGSKFSNYFEAPLII